MKIGAYTFDFERQTLAYKDEEKILLTHRESHLLFHLCDRKNEVLDRSVILKKLWGDDDFFSARSMDVFITKLRKKLKKRRKHPDPECKGLRIQTYRLKIRE